MSVENFNDVLQIKDLIERWVVYRDSFQWDKFRTVWHPDGRFKATWFEGPFEEFIRRNKEGAGKGLHILHILGGSAVEVDGDRAVSMTKFLILQRAKVDGVLCDATCCARHVDRWERRDGKWGLVFRDTVCDKDRLDPVVPGEQVLIDEEKIENFSFDFKYLAYLQMMKGDTVDPDVPGFRGGGSYESLMKKTEDWLAGKS